MRVRSKKHAVELRDNSAKFYNQFGAQAQKLAQGSVRSDYYKAALAHLYNAINGFDYLFEAQLGVLEQKMRLLEIEKQRLEQDLAVAQAAERVKPWAGQPESAWPGVGLRPDRQSAGYGRKTGRSVGGGVAVAALPQALPAVSAASKTLPDPGSALLRALLQGQRNFLDKHNDAGVTGALSFLVQHALTQLHIVSSLYGRQAMYANLYTIATKLSTYKGQPLHGFQAAVDELKRHVPGIAELAVSLPKQKEKRSEAKLFQETLKLLRDQARLDFRPYFYEIGSEGNVLFTVG